MCVWLLACQESYHSKERYHNISNDITVKNISKSFTHKMAAKASWHWNYVTVNRLTKEKKLEARQGRTLARQAAPLELGQYRDIGFGFRLPTRLYAPLAACVQRRLYTTAKISCHSNAPRGIEKLIYDWTSTATVRTTTLKFGEDRWVHYEIKLISEESLKNRDETAAEYKACRVLCCAAK